MAAVTRLGILTGGGDAPGLNAVIRAVVKTATAAGVECVGLEDSFDGLLEPGRTRPLSPCDVRGIIRLGGTVLGTTNRGNPFEYPIENGRTEDRSARVLALYAALGLDGLVIIGGDGTLAISERFARLGLRIVGVPKTIDNDIVGTASCFGFDSAVAFATDAIDRLHVTAEAHHRIVVVEVMGRYAGWIALHAGIAGGADAILMPEIPFDLERVSASLRAREERGSRFSIVVVAEGAVPRGGRVSLVEGAQAGRMERLGGIGARVAAELERLTGKESRAVVLGHLQRGGAPTATDRLLATRFGCAAAERALAGEFGVMVALDPPHIVTRPLAAVVGQTRTVPPDGDLVRAARALGISVGA